MSLRTEKEILDAVREVQQNSSVIRLRKRFEDDYDLWRLESYQLGKKNEYENYTTNEPRTIANKTVEVLESAPIQARIPLEIDNEDERQKKSNAERFYYGIMNLVNSIFEATLQPFIQSQLAWYATHRGWIAVRAIMNKENKITFPDIAIWDMLHTYYDIGSKNITWVCHTRPITKIQAKLEYNIDVAGNSTLVYDMWDDEANSIILNNVFVKEPDPHGCKHIPVLIKAVGATPMIQSEKHTDTLQDRGESIYASNRNIFEPKNKMMTLYQTIVSLGAHNPLAVYSSGGKKTFGKSPYYKGAVIELDIDKGEKVEPLYKPEMPREVIAFLASIQRDLNMGGIPPIAAGELDFQLPYSGIRELIEAARSIIKPRQQAIEETLEWIFREMSTQYASGGFGKLRLHGRDGVNEYFDMELSSGDMKGDWFPEVKLLPQLPEDSAEKIAMAKLAVDAGLNSPQTAMDKYLGVQDTDAEIQKILVWRAKQLPAVQIREMVMALMNEGRMDLANAVMRDYYANMGGQVAPKGQASEAIEPQFASGLPNTLIPPEALGKRQMSNERREMFRGRELKGRGVR